MPAHYQHGAFDAIEKLMHMEALLPAAQATGTERKQLPPWAGELDCTSWAQFFLKFIIGHPAVTCPIPATSSPSHVADNLKAGLGRLPDDKLRGKMRHVLEAS